MTKKKKLQIVATVIIGLTGAYLILSSDRIQVDLYGLILAIIVGIFIFYLYFLYSAQNK